MDAEAAPDNTVSVSVTYSRLPRNSRLRLEEILREWVIWHNKSYPTKVPANVAESCSGTLEFLPDLIDVGGCDCAVAHLDKPHQPEHSERWLSSRSFNLQYEQAGGVPRYECLSAATLDGRNTAQCTVQSSSGTPRKPHQQLQQCFNCGSLLHGLKDCPVTRDSGAIAQARRAHQQGRSSLGNERYFEADKNGADASLTDLKPGVLSADLRAALGGLASTDPPPWLHRMRALGYPPGYMVINGDAEEDDGLLIFDSDTIPAEAQQSMEGAKQADWHLSRCNSQTETMQPPAATQLGAFPGINGPVPEGADSQKWNSALPNGQDASTPPAKRKRMEPQHFAFCTAPPQTPQHTPGSGYATMQQQQQQQQYYPSQHQGAWMQQAHSYSAAGTPEYHSTSATNPQREMHANGQPGLSYHHPTYSAQPAFQQYVQPFGSPFQAPGQVPSNGMLHGQLQQPVTYHLNSGAPVQPLTHSQQYAGSAQHVQQPYCAYSGGNLQANALYGDSRTCNAYSAAGVSEQQKVAPPLMPPLPPDSELGNAYIPPPPPPY